MFRWLYFVRPPEISSDLSGRTVTKTDLALAASHGDVDETASVSESLLGAALRSLLLLLLLDLRGLRLDLACIAKFVRLLFSSCSKSVFVFDALSRGGRLWIHLLVFLHVVVFVDDGNRSGYDGGDGDDWDAEYHGKSNIPARAKLFNNNHR